MADSPSNGRIRFGAFELDACAGELRKGGRKIRLQEQPLQILIMLLARPGEVVTREQIRERLWSNDTTVEFDHSINAAIKRLRDALGDSAESPRFVETIPRRGYRLIAPVEPAAVAVAVPSRPASLVAAPAVVRTARRFTARTWLSAVVVSVVVVAGAVSIVVRTVRDRTADKVPTTLPLTGNFGVETLPSFSPDGQHVAYAWDGAASSDLDIYVKLIGDGPPLRLTTNDAEEFSPVWSPDGRAIAFLRRSADGAGIFVVPALGGPERQLGHSAARWFPAGVAYGTLSWSPDGKFLALMDRAAPNEAESIFLLTIESGAKRRLTSPSSEWRFGDGSPAFSPDGRMLAFGRSAGILVSDVFVQRLSSDGAPVGDPTRLTFDRRAIFALDWTPDGSEIVFSSNRGGSLALWKVPTSGGAPEPLAPSGSDPYWLSVARQGRRMAYVSRLTNQNIWRTDGPLGSVAIDQADANRTRWIFSQRVNSAPQFSPDGRKVAFASNRSGHQEIWAADSDGSNPVQLTFVAGPNVASPRWSPDGRRIAFESSKEALKNIYVMDSDGKSLRRLTTDVFQNVRPSWSRDGQRIYFGSTRSGSWQIWKAPAEGGPPTQVTKGGGQEAFESIDGEYLYYSKPRGVSGIWRRPVQGSEETEVLGQAVMDHWALLDRGICFLKLDANAPVIQFFDFTTRRAVIVAVLPKGAVPPDGWGTPAIAVSPNGRTILYVQGERTESHIQVVDHFR